MANLDIAGNIISADKMFNDAFTNQQQQQYNQQPQQTLPSPPVNDGSEKSFQEEFFPQYDPTTILENLGPLKNDPSRVKYRFIGDGKIYNAKADKPLDKVLEGIWDKNSPGLWGTAKAQTLYGLPADMSSAIAYGLGGLGLDESSDEWRDYSNGLREEFQKKYGQFMTPGFEAALEKGRLLDFAAQSIGTGAPYMGLALTGGWLGTLAVGTAGATSTGAVALGGFLGASTITSPVTIAQFADRQVEEMVKAGMTQEEAEKRIDWFEAAGLGTIAAGLQALPVESILMGGPLLGMLTKWGTKVGTPASARILAAMGDTAGTNALAGAGTSYLSRMNADMPLLDDDAKAEYLEAGIIGGLVGLPFGIYRGLKPHYTKPIEDKPLDQIINENRAPEDSQPVQPSSGEGKPEVAGLLPPPKHSIIYNPNETYGIQNAEDAANYLNNINYKSSEDGLQRNGLDDFVRKHGISYSDAEIIDAARRISMIKGQQDYVQRTPDGVVYPSIDSIPQVHSNDPKILTKAAELTDRYGYEDTVVRSLNDRLVEKLHEVNLKRDLEKTSSKVHKDVFDQVLEKAKNHVNEKVIQDVQQYGSLYARPEAKERVNLSTKERRELVSKNPREEMAKAILGTKRPKDRDAQRQPDEAEPLGDRSLEKLTKDAKGKFLKQAVRTGQERAPEGPRALLEYKPLVDMIDKGANQPGPRITPEISKADFNDFLQNSPFIKDLFGKDAKLADIKAALAKGKKELARVEKEKQKQAAANNDAPGIPLGRNKEPNKSLMGKELPFDKTEEQFLVDLRNRLSRVAAERNADLLKQNPELGPALNDMFKRFTELEGVTELTKNSTTKAYKARPGILDALENRARVSRTLQNAFQYLDKKIGVKFANTLDNMLSGKEVTPYDAADTITLLDMAFNFDNPTEFKHINISAVESIYRQIRNTLPDSAKKSLESSRDFLEKWYKSTKNINEKDLKGFRTEDLEADAFSDYIRDTLNISARQFKGSKQQKLFSSIETSLKRLKKELNDQSFRSVEDLLEFNKSSNERVPPEAQRPGVFHRRVVQEAQQAKATEKVVEDAARVEENANDLNTSIPKNGFQKPPSGHKGTELQGDLERTANNVGPLWGYTAWMRSIPSLAKDNPLFSKIYNVIRDQHNLAATYQNQHVLKFSKQFDEGGGWQPMNEAHNIIDHLKFTGQKLIKDTSGRLIFKDKDGKDVTLNHAMTKSVEGVNDYYKEAYRIKEQIHRKDMAKYYKEEGLTPDSSIAHIKRVIDGYDQKIKGNPLPEVAAKYRLQKEALETLHDKIVEANRIIQKEEPYIPYMRFGDYVVDVIDRKTGKQEFMTSINEHTKFGSKSRNPTEKEGLQKMRELGLYDKFPSNKYEHRQYKLTYNQIGEYLQKGLVTTDLIQSLLSSGLNEHLKMSDHFATGIDDPVQFFKDMRHDVNTNKYRILRYVHARGAGRFGLNSENIPGYSKDWARVMDSYTNIQVNSLAKQAKLQDWGEAQAELIRSPAPQHLKDKINKYVDYQNNSGNDFAGIRTFNFVMAMGARPASAILQLLNLPQQTFGLGLAYSPHVLKNAGELSAAMARTMPNVTTMGRVKLRKEIQDIIDRDPGSYRTSVMQDVLKEKIPGQDFISTMLPKDTMGATALQRTGQVIGKIPGMFIQPAERLTRISSLDFFYTMFKTRPETLAKAIKYREKDYDWQEFWRNRKDRGIEIEEALATYSMLETHAVYGKEARGDIQRGLAGALLVPFTTFSQQMLETLISQISRQHGAAGVAAGLWTASTYMLFAGASGIPAYELWKTMYEQYQAKVNNRIVDGEMEMKEAGIPDWMRHGLLSSSTGLDLSSRVGQEVVGQNIMQGLIKGEFKINEVGGVPGRTVKGLIDAIGEWGNETSTKSPMSLVAPILPGALTDLGKAYQLATSPEDVLKTSSGKMIRDPSSIDTGDIIARATGFGTMADREARQQIYWQQRANQEFNQAKSRLAEGIAMARYKMVQGSRTGNSEQYESGRELLKEMQRALMKHAKDNKIVLNNKFWSGFNRSVQDRLWQKMNPGKIRKPTEGEIRHIESLIDNDND